MPPQALALAFAASIYPPAVAAVIALGRGEQLRSRVFAFVLAAALTTYVVGAAMLFALEGIGATRRSDLSLELRRLHRPRRAADAAGRPPAAQAPQASRGRGRREGPSKIDHYLQSRRLAFVLGITLYFLPSPIYAGAVKAIADARLSTSAELLALAVAVAVMLWMIEIPMLMLLIVPARAGACARSAQPVVRASTAGPSRSSSRRRPACIS